MLNVPEPSPPVPTTSIVPSGASTRSTRSRIADANPASSSTVSPRIRSATSSAASCAGVASPSMTAPIASRASSSVRRPALDARRQRRANCLAHRLPSGGRRRRQPSGSAHPGRRERAGHGVQPRRLALARLAQEVREQVRALRRQHALGMELDALERQRRVAEAHHDPVLLAHRGHAQLRRGASRHRRTASGSARP